MARERWFYAQGNQRRGPVLFNQLVESVLGQAEPRTVLVWRKGFAEWTRAEDVPEVERRLAPFFAKKAAEEAAKRGPAPAPVEAQPARPVRVEEVKPGSPALVYGGIAGGVAGLGLLAWVFRPRAEPQAPAPPARPLGGTTTDNSPAVVIPARPRETPVPTETPTPVTRPTPTPTPAAAALSDRESDLPAAATQR